MSLTKPSYWASHFFWSYLRYALIGWTLIKLIGHDLKRQTPVYMRSHSCQWHIRANTKPRGNRIVSGHKKLLLLLKVPKYTVALTLTWKPGQTEQLRSKGLSKRGYQEPDGHSGWVPKILCGVGRNFQKDNDNCNTPSIWALWQSGQTAASPQLKTQESPLRVCKKQTETRSWWNQDWTVWPQFYSVLSECTVYMT